MAKKVAIIGGGASGLMCAIFCAKKALDVELFEQNSKCAKKILVSGNGRCNITNTHFTKANYISDNPDFVTHALSAFDFVAFEKFVNSIGLILHKKEDGRCYPLSNEAKSVAHLLEDYARSLGVKIHLNSRVESLNEMFKNYSHVVVATGSQAASHLGGNEDGMKFSQEFNHTTLATYPSLVQLHLNSSVAPKMSGAKVEGEVTLLINHKKDSTARGDILFTKYGVSGFSILDISARASQALLNYERVTLSLNLLPSFTPQKLSSHILQVAKNMPAFSVLEILVGLTPIKIATNLLEHLEISPTLSADAIHTKLAKKIANTLLNWRFEVSDTHGFRHAEVSGGGVNTQEIDPKTMESKKRKNLYFIGEVVDVVGHRGGYNFAWAWASGVCAAKSISKE